MALSRSNYRKILDLIDVIYSIPDQKTMIRAVFDGFQKSIGIHSTVFISTDPKSGEFRYCGYEAYNGSEEAVLAYLAHYSKLDTFVFDDWFKNHVNMAARSADLVPDLINTEFAADFLIPMTNVLYSLGARLGSQGDTVGMFIMGRERHERNFARRDMEIVNCILSHLARAIHNMELSNPVEKDCGVIMTDEKGKPVFMNVTAREALKGSAVENIPDPGLGSGAAFFKNGPFTFRVRTVPASRWKKGKFILLDPHPPTRVLDSALGRLEPARYKLSRREKEIAVLVIQGRSNREIAESLFIREKTVKDHLNNIFSKLEIRGRCELAAMALGLLTRPDERITSERKGRTDSNS